MEITLLVKTIIGLVVVLGILVFILVLPKQQEKKKKQAKASSRKSSGPKTDLESLRHTIRNRMASKKELQEALDLVIKHHGHIPKKLGTRTNPGFDSYMEILIMICRHPNTDKNIILGFDKQLSALNPNYKSEINESITKGLNSRSI